MLALGSKKWKLLGLTLGAVLTLALAGAGVLWFRVASPVDQTAFGETSALDAREANRKLKLFESALSSGPPGFIRLSRAEINSLIDDRFGSKSTNAPTQFPALVKCRIDFNPSTLNVICWVQQKILGRTSTVAWQRSGAVARQGDHWEFQPTSMKLGSQTVPTWLWPKVQARLGPVDELLAQHGALFARVPTLHFTENDLTKQAELRIYTYAETNLLTQAKP